MRPIAAMFGTLGELTVIREDGVRFCTTELRGGEPLLRLHPFDSDLNDLIEGEASREATREAGRWEREAVIRALKSSSRSPMERVERALAVLGVEVPWAHPVQGTEK